MDDYTDNHYAPEDHTESEERAEETPAPRRRRWRRPNGRWTNPATPLQAARFAARMSGKDVAAAVRRLCEGHAGRACKFEVSKLSDFEHQRRTPSIEHIVAFCKLYQRSPEELGLIQWRDEATPEGEPAPPPSRKPTASHDDPDQEQLVLDWLRESAAAVAGVVMQVLAECPLKPGSREESSGHQLASDDDPSDEDPPTGTAVPV